MANAQIPFVPFLAASYLLLSLHGTQAESEEREAAGRIPHIGTPPVIQNSFPSSHTSPFTPRVYLHVAQGEVKAPSPRLSIQ